MADMKRRTPNPITTTPRQLARAYGEYIRTYPWNVFMTGTIDSERCNHVPTAATAKGEWKRYLQRINAMAGQPGGIRYVRGIESVVEGHYHVHALMADVADLTVEEMRRAWKAGRITDVRRYDPTRAGALYVCFEAAVHEDPQMLEIELTQPTSDTDVVTSTVTTLEVSSAMSDAPVIEHVIERTRRARDAAPPAVGMSGFRLSLERRRDEHARLGSMVSASALLDDVLKDFDKAAGEDDDAIPVAEAAGILGMHPDSIGRLIRQGKVHRYGTKRRPRVRVADFGHRRQPAPLLSVAPVTVEGETSPVDEAVIGTIALEAVAGRHGRARPA